ncbi:hypothetical protein DRJ17_07425 [Candidatus Woesearchaeota archaeon]|nr:MAG: hypothetical protein DRJ17_07425 [Candidatus Woesearchaeota archaeon]
MRAFPVIKKIDKTIGSSFVLLLSRITKKSPRKHLGKKDVKNILIIKFGNIGDAVLTIPAIRATRKHFPKARMVMVTSNRTKGLYKQYHYFNKIITIDLVENKNLVKSAVNTSVNMIKLILEVKKHKFDIAIDFESYSTFSAFLAFISGADTRIGADIGYNHRKDLFTHTTPYFQDNRHELDLYIDLISLIGIKTKNKKLEFNISKKDRQYADQILKKNGFSKKRKLIAVHAGGNPDWMIKRWPKENFAKLIERISIKHSVNFILIGSSDECSLNSRIIKLSKKNAANIAGKNTLNQMAALITKCNLFICNDSAPMHISAAVKTPVIALMGYVNPKRWGPYGKGHTALTNASPDNPHWNGYMDINAELKQTPPVAVKDVIKAVDKQIAVLDNR